VRELFETHIGYRLPDDISNMISELEDAIELECWYPCGVIPGHVYRFEGQISGKEYYFCSKQHWDSFKRESLCCKCEREFRIPGVEYDESGYYACESVFFRRFQPGQLRCEDCSEGDIRCMCALCRQEFKLCDLTVIDKALLCGKCRVKDQSWG